MLYHDEELRQLTVAYITSKFPGTKVKLQQTGGAVKHFINTGVGYSSPNTVLTLYGGTDYDLANSPIIEPYFSAAKVPLDSH